MKIKYICVHCSASPLGRGDGAREIHRWHLEKGWSGVGYHYVIPESGEVEAGRPEYWQGAHEPKINSCSIAICLIGDGVYTHKQVSALRTLIENLLGRYPNAEVVGHRDFRRDKTCPEFDAGGWWRGELYHGLIMKDENDDQ